MMVRESIVPIEHIHIMKYVEQYTMWSFEEKTLMDDEIICIFS